MTMLRRNRNPLLVEPLPVEPEEDRAGTPGFGDIEGLPDDLQPEEFLRQMRANFPKELYLAQLEDWFFDQMTAKLTGDPFTEKQGIPSAKRRAYMAKRDAILAEVEYWLEEGIEPEDMDAYVTGLPDFKKISGSIGKRSIQAYEDYAIDYMDDQEVKQMSETAQKAGLVDRIRGLYGEAAAEKASERLLSPEENIMYRAQRETERQQTRQKLLGKADERYGADVAKAIREGTITETEAETLRRTQMREGAPILNSKMGDTRARRLAATQAGRQRLETAVTEGAVSGEEAFGAGTPWESWQQEQAGQERAQQAQTWQGDKVGLTPLIREAQQLGIQLPQGIEQVLQPTMSVEVQGNYAAALKQQITNVRNQQREEYGNFLVQDYPELFKEQQAKFTQGMAGSPPWGASNFALWTQPDEEGNLNPEWQKAYTAKEAQRWGEYGDLYGSYKSQLRKTGYAKAKPFETWMTEDPQAVAWMEDYKKRKAAEEQRTKRRLAPGVVG